MPFVFLYLKPAEMGDAQRVWLLLHFLICSHRTLSQNVSNDIHASARNFSEARALTEESLEQQDASVKTKYKSEP